MASNDPQSSPGAGKTAYKYTMVFSGAAFIAPAQPLARRAGK